MKSSHLTDVTKVLILVATVIIVCILVAIGYKIINNGKAAVSANTNTMNEMSGQFQEIDMALYDGSLVPGSEIVDILKDVIDEQKFLSVIMQPLSGSATIYNYVPTSDKKALSTDTGLKNVPTDKGQPGYINPMAMYLGKTYKDSNNSIIIMAFTQQP